MSFDGVVLEYEAALRAEVDREGVLVALAPYVVLSRSRVLHWYAKMLDRCVVGDLDVATTIAHLDAQEPVEWDRQLARVWTDRLPVGVASECAR